MDLLAFVLAISAEGITDEQVQTALNAYIVEHPEAVTTVMDGSITKAKLDSNLQAAVDDLGGLKSAIEDLEAGSLSALGASSGQVPTADGEGSWDWQNQPVTDVQVNGVSVLNEQGVANVPVAGVATYGVVRVTQAFGISIQNGFLTMSFAEPEYTQDGTHLRKVIVPGNQHESTFYGLAKAAGADMALSSNPVGTYTDAAKSAIQTMLGISGIIAPVEGATASKPYAIGDAFLHGGALYKASAAITEGDAIVPGTNCTQTTIIEMLKGA